MYDVDDRGPNFHREMDPDESDLVPRAERGPVTVTDYRFRSEAVADSRAGLRKYVEPEVVDGAFDGEWYRGSLTLS